MEHEDCAFCQIAAGAAPAHRVYETDSTVAFLDIRPVKRGHTLVIPRTHVAELPGLEPELGMETFRVVHLIACAMRDARIGADGANIVVNDGRAAFQTVAHTHFHVVPRSRGDKTQLAAGLITRRGTRLPDIAAALRSAIHDTAQRQDEYPA
ncbi:HIT domain-containing protein [Hoyosella sp. YIM 151337]|uniref:HIT family protein n=1 Tax=Hoyosella sp. YIM 151337 TaxID=2992742 RepID=UPI002235D565|nr:HIT domain-containing protein [Hoyosella sp. YIM 151337]MCW4355159.1 HIT domain-containing protein [Hoyosella sp. YIM 151337]